MPVREHVTDLLPAYALGCLDEDELNQVYKHLAECESCQAELRSFQAVADRLPLAVAEVEPPPRVKQALMERVSRTEKRMEADSRQVSWLNRVGGWLQKVSPVWSLASLTLIVFLLLSNAFLWVQLKRVQDLTQVTTLRVVNLSATSAAPGATGMIVVSLNGEHGTLIVDRLPRLGAEQQYQLWLIKDGQRTSGGVFSVDYDGYASLWVTSPQPLGDYTAFGITIEPAGGSLAPTGPKVLGG